MELIRWLRCFRLRDRRTKRIAFWAVSMGFFLLVLAYNKATINLVSKYSSFETEPIDIRADIVMANGLVPKAYVGQDQAQMQRSPQEAFPPISAEEKDDRRSDLMPDLGPSTLHYVWCGAGRYFEFRHYLALKSAMKIIMPDKVYFHFEYLPEVDPEGYFLWFKQLKKEVSRLILHQMNDTAKCQRTGADRFMLVTGLLYEHGGIYIPEDAILIDFPVHLRTLSIVTGVEARTETDFLDGLMIGKRGSFKKPENYNELQILLSLGREEHGSIKPCSSEQLYEYDTRGHVMCVKVERELRPKDIWSQESKFADLARVIMYGVRTIRVFHDAFSVVPKITHYLCVDSCELNFEAYLSLLSSIYVAGFQKVYIHGPSAPKGIWWDRLANNPRFVYVYREYPETLSNGVPMSPGLATCIMRIDILLKYGGVYQDRHVLWTQTIPDHYFGYDAVVSPDWHSFGDWPESINHGVIIAKRNSKYLELLREVFQKFTTYQYWFNDHYMSYKIIEMHPDLVFIDPHLQVKCLNHNCHPTWQEPYRSGMLQNRPGGSFSWENETVSVHWLDNFPELDPDMVRYTSGIAIDISRYILRSAGIDIRSV